MQLNIHSIHFDADKKLVDFINKKCEKLLLFDQSIISGDVFLKSDKVEIQENKTVEVKLLASGSEFFASKKSSSFEEALDLSVEAIRRQIQKSKKKSRIM